MVYLFRVNDQSDNKNQFTIRFVFAAIERNQVDEFFTQSSLTQKPVVKHSFDVLSLEIFFHL